MVSAKDSYLLRALLKELKLTPIPVSRYVIQLAWGPYWEDFGRVPVLGTRPKSA